MKELPQITCVIRFILASTLWLCLPSLALAQTYIVTSVADSGPFTLRAAIEWANDPGNAGPLTITFDPGMAGSTIHLTSGELLLEPLHSRAKTLNIQGPGARQLSIVNDTDRVLEVGAEPLLGQPLYLWTANISGLSLTGSRRGNNGADGTYASPGRNGADAEGGGILNDGILTLTDCVMRDCCAIGGDGGAGVDWVYLANEGRAQPGGSGGYAVGGAIRNHGQLYLNRCCFRNNRAVAGNGKRGGSHATSAAFPGQDGGSGGGAAGGAVVSGDVCPFLGEEFLSVVNCTFYQNSVTGGNGADGGNGVARGAGGPGGAGNGGHAGSAEGGAILVMNGCDDPRCTKRSCTVSGNSAVSGTAGYGGHPGGQDGYDVSGAGGGLLFDGEFHLQNCLIAGNSANGTSVDVGEGAGGTGVSEGFNLIGDPTGPAWAWTATDLHPCPEPMLDVLADNGGSTPTMALLPGSPAIDKGFSGGVTTDQRGSPYSRPCDYPGTPNADGGDGSDIGAYERHPCSGTPWSDDVVMPPGYSLSAFGLIATDNRVAALFNGASWDGLSIFKIGPSGLAGSSCLNNQWSDPNLTLSPGEAWFFHNPYPTSFSMPLNGTLPAGPLPKSLPRDWSACSSSAHASGRLQTDLFFPPPLNMDVFIWNGVTYESFPYNGSWTSGEPWIALGQAFFVNLPDGGLDWVQQADESGNLLSGSANLNNQAAWPVPGAMLNFLTFNQPDGPTAHRVGDTGGTPLDHNYYGQLYGGADANPSSFTALGTWAEFRDGTTAGFIASGLVPVPGGELDRGFNMHLRCWKHEPGERPVVTFEDALDQGKALGISAVMCRVPGGGLPTSPPPDVNTFPSFNLVEQNHWTSGYGIWGDAFNWSRGAPSDTSDPGEWIGAEGQATVIVDDATAADHPETMTVNNIVVSGADNTLTLDFGGVPGAELVVHYDLHIVDGGHFNASGCSYRVEGRSSFIVDGDARLEDASLYAAKVKIAQAGPGHFSLNGGMAQIGELWIGYGDVGQLTNNGAILIVSNIVLGGLPGSQGSLVMHDGTITPSITNGLNIIVGQGGAGTLMLDGGTISATTVFLTNGPQSVLAMGGGLLDSGSVTIGPGAILSGHGTVAGAVGNQGNILAGGAALAFTGPVTNYGNIVAGSGTLVSFSGPVVNYGVLDYSQGRAGFASTLQNYGTLVPPLPRPGCALSFDGIDAGVVVPGFLTNAPDSEVTVEFWMKPDAVAVQAAFCPSGGVNGAAFAAYLPCGTAGNGSVYWDFGDTNNGGHMVYNLPYSIVGLWNHFAFVASQSNNWMHLYQNGALVASKKKMTTLLRTNLDLIIGGGAAGVPFNGLLEEFRIWNIARNQADIQSTLYCSLTGLEPGLVAYWPMNECGGTNLYDASAPAANTGTLVNSTLWTTSNIPFVPTVLTTYPTLLGPDSASLGASVNPNGQATTVWFQWGTTTNYDQATPEAYLGSGWADLATSAIITGLVQNVTYHYRAVATNCVGLNYGADLTLEIPVPPAPLLLSIAQTGANVTISWPLSGQNVIFEQTSDLRATNWTSAKVLSGFIGTNFTVTCPIGPSNVFYRLRKL